MGERGRSALTAVWKTAPHAENVCFFAGCSRRSSQSSRLLSGNFPGRIRTSGLADHLVTLGPQSDPKLNRSVWFPSHAAAQEVWEFQISSFPIVLQKHTCQVSLHNQRSHFCKATIQNKTKLICVAASECYVTKQAHYIKTCCFLQLRGRALFVETPSS